MKIKINRNCLLKIFLEEFKSEEVLIISISLQIARVPLLFYALFLSVNANEKMICICIIWAQLHMWDDVLCINLPASFLSALYIEELEESSGGGDFTQSLWTLKKSGHFSWYLLPRSDGTGWGSENLFILLWLILPLSKTNIVLGQVFVWQLDCMFYHYLQDLTSVHSAHKKRTPWVTISNESMC